jgi:diguanylate cyclase (GGDEF)-like protein
MPAILKSDNQATNGTLGALPYWDVVIDASQTIRELLEILDKNIQIPGILVFEKKLLIGLIARDNVYEKLGRPFGVELFLKNNNKQFYESLGVTTLILGVDTLIDNAVKIALMRSAQTLYEPIVVADMDGYRVISMYSLLIAQQDTMQGLYSEVRNLSTKDPLTLINNRRGFFDAVNLQLTAIRHFDLEHAVLMIDIDNFKNINDRYGHMVGDEVIKSVAQRIYSQIQKKDILGRFGGEEFVILLTDISKDSAVNLAESLRQDIASFFHTINWFQIRVTISVGMTHSKGASHTFDRLLTEADQAVYIAKNKGRNKVTVWDESLNHPSSAHQIFRAEVNETEHQSAIVPTQTLQGLLRMLYLRDHETEAHTIRVSEMALKLAEKAGVQEKEFEGIRIGSLLHDIGKIAIPDKILLKREKLTDPEWAIMQRHPQYAYDLISPISYFQHALDIPYCHHEHWNGKGYPRGLREEEIPFTARIFTIVDVWDALSSDRPYRAAWKAEEIKDFLISKSSILFDPTLIQLFLGLLD